MTLMQLVQEAMPECEWSPDNDGEPLCKQRDVILGVYTGEDGDTYAGYFMSVALVSMQPDDLAKVVAHGFSLGSNTSGLTFYASVNTAPEIAQFFHNAEKLRKEIWPTS